MRREDEPLLEFGRLWKQKNAQYAPWRLPNKKKSTWWLWLLMEEERWPLLTLIKSLPSNTKKALWSDSPRCDHSSYLLPPVRYVWYYCDYQIQMKRCGISRTISYKLWGLTVAHTKQYCLHVHLQCQFSLAVHWAPNTVSFRLTALQ